MHAAYLIYYIHGMLCSIGPILSLVLSYFQQVSGKFFRPSLACIADELQGEIQRHWALLVLEPPALITTQLELSCLDLCATDLQNIAPAMVSCQCFSGTLERCSWHARTFPNRFCSVVCPCCRNYSKTGTGWETPFLPEQMNFSE